MKRARRRGWAACLLVQAMAALLICESAARLLTKASPANGMPMIGRYALIPYRPEPEAVRAWLRRASAARYVVPDPLLGWTLKPGGSAREGFYLANAEGVRAPAGRIYGERPASGRLRMVTVGDSFTHGDGVGIEETWQRELERQRDDLEVINLGVPAYGTDQAFLRWRRDGVRFHPQLALLCVWPENMCRNLSVVRYFLQPGGGFLAKPRFLLAGRRLTPPTTPVLEGEALVQAVTDPARTPLLRHDYWAAQAIPDELEPRAWQRLRLARALATAVSLHHRRAQRERLYSGADPQGIDLTVAIADAFRRDAEREGATPLVVMIPMLDLLAPYSGEDSLPLVQALRVRGLNVIDLGPPMARVVRERGSSCCFQADHHLSPEGNRLLAGWLLARSGACLDRLRDSSGPQEAAVLDHSHRTPDAQEPRAPLGATGTGGLP